MKACFQTSQILVGEEYVAKMPRILRADLWHQASTRVRYWSVRVPASRPWQRGGDKGSAENNIYCVVLAVANQPQVA